ncbi:MAG TPA: iron ABC transporter permease [Lachnospiraceae bacterium]|nr:iron ABC transporter permease [Lachnospiraceae bacterium]
MKKKKSTVTIVLLSVLILIIVFVAALLFGKYPISLEKLLSQDTMAASVFYTLRLPRALMALFGGFGLGIAGMVYQTIFRNPLASPDIIGVSSGASAGAAFAILFLSAAALPVTISAFLGGFFAVLISLALSSLAPRKGNYTIVLSGIAVQSLCQTFLMILKTTADPEKELASIEYWIMGSLSTITSSKIPVHIVIIVAGSAAIFFLYRQVLLLSVEDEEAKMLGVPVRQMRLFVILAATLIVAAVISITGLISFIGLLAPHIAKLLTGKSHLKTLILSGLWGSILLLLADTLAKNVASGELPVSIFTSLLGAPFLLYLLIRRSPHES